jgi:hypothetical protein
MCLGLASMYRGAIDSRSALRSFTWRRFREDKTFVAAAMSAAIQASVVAAEAVIIVY